MATSEKKKVVSGLSTELARGRELFQVGNYVDAKDVFEELYKKYPDEEEVQNYLGMVLFKLHLNKEAIDLYKKLLDKAPNIPSIHLNLGIIYYKEENYELAFEEFINTLESDPNNKRAQNYIGLIHMAKGNYDEALATFTLTGSKKMIKEAKEKIRDLKRETFQSSASKSSSPKEKEAGDRTDKKKEKDRFSFADIKKSFMEKKNKQQTEIRGVSIIKGTPSIKEAAEDLMRDVFIDDSAMLFFDVYQNLLKLNIKDEVYTRLSHLESFSGDLEFKVTKKVVEGKESDMLFGTSENMFFKVTGNGHLILSLGSQVITSFKLENDDFYVNENYLLAFEKSVKYENSERKLAETFDLVKLSGKGTIILINDKKPITQAIDTDSPLAIRLEYIIGWYGKLRSHMIKGKDNFFKRREDSKWVTFKGDGYIFSLVK